MRQQESCAVSCQPSFRERARGQFKLWVGVPLALLLFCTPAYAEPLNEKEKVLEEISKNTSSFTLNMMQGGYINGRRKKFYQKLCQTQQLVDITCDESTTRLHINFGPVHGAWIIQFTNNMLKKAKQENSFNSELLKSRIYNNSSYNGSIGRLYNNRSKTGMPIFAPKWDETGFTLFTRKFFDRAGDRDFNFIEVSLGFGIPITIPMLVKAKAVCHLPADSARLSKRKSVFSGKCEIIKDTQKRQ